MKNNIVNGTKYTNYVWLGLETMPELLVKNFFSQI